MSHNFRFARRTHDENNTKAQFWAIDFIVSAALFMASLYLFFSHTQAPSSELLFDEAQYISTSLMQTGFPPNWNDSSVTHIGLIGEPSSLSEEKLQALYSMSPQTLKAKFGVRGYVQISVLNSSTPIAINATTFAGYNASTINATIAASDRYVLYKNDIVTLRVLVWS